ncbi:MAG: OmpP1/FadL family transporter [Myxococcota bacterium]
MLILLATLAQAGGYYYSDSGIVSAGRAGAWVAGADTQFAQRINPAGIIRVDAPTFNIGVTGVQQNIRFDRIDDTGVTLPTTQNEAPPFGVPQLGFATPIGDKFGVAFGFVSPYAPSSEYDPNGSQRYSIIGTDIWQFAVGGTVAWSPVKQFTVGASVGTQALKVRDTLKVTTNGPDSDGADRPSGDILVTADTWDRVQPWWNLGVLIEPHERVSVGLSMTPPTAFKARGPGELDFTGHGLESALDQVVWTDDDVTLNVSIPVILRAGVAVRPIDGLEIELAGVYENWSALADLEVEDIDVTVTSESFNLSRQVPPTLSLPSDFRDVVSIRLGGEWRATPGFEVRAGAMWERGALAPKNLSMALVDPNKAQLSLGGSGWVVDKRLRFDGMASLLMFPTLDIRDSEVTQVGIPVTSDSVDVGTVGNGTVQSSGWTLGVQLNYAIVGKSRKNARNTTEITPEP